MFHRPVAKLLHPCLYECPSQECWNLGEVGVGVGNTSEEVITWTTKPYPNLVLCVLNSLHLCNPQSPVEQTLSLCEETEAQGTSDLPNER